MHSWGVSFAPVLCHRRLVKTGPELRGAAARHEETRRVTDVRRDMISCGRRRSSNPPNGPAVSWRIVYPPRGDRAHSLQLV